MLWIIIFILFISLISFPLNGSSKVVKPKDSTPMSDDEFEELFKLIDNLPSDVSHDKSIDRKTEEEFYSTTAIGKKLDIQQKEIITKFIELNLLRRDHNNKLELTILGKNIGGDYRRNGSEAWIVWHKNIINHPLLKDIRKPVLLGQKPSGDEEINNDITTYGYYHPYRGGQNPLFDSFSANILDFKNNKESAVEYFFKLLIKIDFANTEVIVIIPSHDPIKKMSPVKILAQKLAKHFGWIDGTECLVRKYKIDKLAYGGNRDINTHLQSLKVVSQSLIARKNILVLDDVTTSGHSLQAGKKLILDSKAKSVKLYALAKTV
jgi:hypothetical protein